ncbi:MmyB family transcriptional regulator [Catenulispora pinisilvae]|uniref:MmyB family transcriptional regulator n=1 Tax=Catenulispora pinisilvae TaxID=2705253 RepID=UPI0018915A76
MDLAELGGFLKSRRDRIRPREVGLPSGPRRRVPGLRRDEVAQLAGASVDYYIELERGGAQPSEQMLAALARALRLSRDERDHLYHLAGRPVPPAGSAAAHVSPGMMDLLDRLVDTPARVITDLHVVLVQNRLAAALLGPPPPGTTARAGFVYRWFTDPAARGLYPPADHARHAESFVADLRAAVARRGRHDEESRSLVAELLERSPEFAELWSRHDVAVRRLDAKRIVHPALGVIDVNCLNLLSEDGSQRLLWFSPVAGTDAVEKLELLSVLGIQDLESDQALESGTDLSAGPSQTFQP